MKKQPMRKCSGCCEMKEKRELVRIVRAPLKTDGDGTASEQAEISLDLTGKKPGRGVYVCRNAECLKKAMKAKRPERSLGCKIPDEVYERLIAEISSEDRGSDYYE